MYICKSNVQYKISWLTCIPFGNSFHSHMEVQRNTDGDTPSSTLCLYGHFRGELFSRFSLSREKIIDRENKLVYTIQQYYGCKSDNFQLKNYDFFLSAQNIECAYSLTCLTEAVLTST